MPAVLHALDAPTFFTLNLPFGANQATPAWLGHPETPADSFATLNLPVSPPDATASLLVTVFFQEKTGGFLRLTWQDPQSAQVLTDNFYEGIGMNNQRSLLITPQTMKDSGTLTFQCGDVDLNIQRIQLQWLENQTGITSPAITDVLVTPANGATTLASTLNGQPQPADAAAWRDRIVNVPVTDAPLRIEQGVEFSVQMDTVPATARLAVSEDGLAWGQHLVVWINGQRAGTVAPSVPDLSDGGYADTNKASAPYVGWRDGTLFVPVSSFKVGANTLQFSAEPDASTSAAVDPDAAPLAVKNVSLQLDYPAADATAAAAAATGTTTDATVPSDTLTNTAPAVTPAADSSAQPAESPAKSGLLSLPQ